MKVGDLVYDDFSGKHGVILNFLKQEIRTPWRAKGEYVEVLFGSEILIGPTENLKVIHEGRRSNKTKVN